MTRTYVKVHSKICQVATPRDPTPLVPMRRVAVSNPEPPNHACVRKLHMFFSQKIQPIIPKLHTQPKIKNETHTAFLFDRNINRTRSRRKFELGIPDITCLGRSVANCYHPQLRYIMFVCMREGCVDLCPARTDETGCSILSYTIVFQPTPGM